jgi:VWFA-related protein
MDMKNNLLRAFAFLGALVVAGVPAGAQQAPAAPAEPQAPASVFGEQIEVRVVNVEAVVTDKKGNRVSNLQPSDFRLMVDGKEVSIEYFTEILGGLAVEGPSQEAPVQGLPGITPGSPVGTSYLVFVDDFFSVSARRNEVLRKLKEDIARLGPEDRMAIVAFDGRSLKMLTTWSRNERDLRRALDDAALRRAYGLERVTELRRMETSRSLGINQGLGPRAAFADRLDFDEREYALRLTNQIQRVVSATVSTLRGFASPPGRKVMILLSGGWPANPSQYVVNSPVRQVFEGELPENRELYQPLTDTANRLGYTIYTVDVPGLDTEATNATASSVPSQSNSNIFREQEVQSTLQYVAEETGGRALINSARLQAFETSETDTRSYYWIGFTPPWQGNDQRHTVKVEVRNAGLGLQVRSRDSFLDLSRRAETSMMVESAMLFGSGPGAAKLPLKLGEPVAAGRREMEVPLTIAIPVDAVTAVPIDGKFVAELELRVAAMDEQGNPSEMPLIPIRLSFPSQPTAGKFLPYSVKLRLRRLENHLVLGLFDPNSSNILTAEADVKPPKKGKG